MDHYGGLKKKVGMDLHSFDIPVDNTSDVTFSALHPDATITFKEILNSP